LRNQKTLSLNLEQRRTERNKFEAERLARENTRRAAHDLPPLKSIDEMKPDDLPDVQLEQAIEIVADLVTPAPAKTASAK